MTRDSRLACGLSSTEAGALASGWEISQRNPAKVFDLLFRDITPDDYETLLRLDESVDRSRHAAKVSLHRCLALCSVSVLAHSLSLPLSVSEHVRWFVDIHIMLNYKYIYIHACMHTYIHIYIYIYAYIYIYIHI